MLLKTFIAQAAPVIARQRVVAHAAGTEMPMDGAGGFYSLSTIRAVLCGSEAFQPACAPDPDCGFASPARALDYLHEAGVAGLTLDAGKLRPETAAAIRQSRFAAGIQIMTEFIKASVGWDHVERSVISAANIEARTVRCANEANEADPLNYKGQLDGVLPPRPSQD